MLSVAKWVCDTICAVLSYLLVTGLLILPCSLWQIISSSMSPF